MPLIFAAQERDVTMMYGSGMMGNFDMMGPLMWLFMLLIWGFAILGLFCAIRWLTAHTKPGTDKKAKSLGR